jgi:endo-1,4-beta-xylanase
VGTVSLLATVVNGTAQDTNYTQNFSVTISGSGNNFVAVSGITGVPVSATVGIPLTLNGTVSPSNATNKDILWTVSNAGTTGANISGNTLNTTGAGSVTITANVANGIAQGTAYTQNFNITVNTSFVAVSNITGVPTSATVGTPLTLSGAVSPSNATNQTIVWTVSNAGTTGASISGNTLNTTNAGTVTVTATIVNGQTASTNYTQNFSITVNTAFVAVSGITNVPTTATAGTPLALSGTITPSNATNQNITWTVSNAGTTGASISGNTLNTTGAGTVILTATIVNGQTASTNYTQNFTITVNAVTVQQPESFTITFTQIADEAPEIIGPTIYRSSANRPRTATIELDNPGQYNFINWYITGTTVSGVGPSITLSALNILYNNAGQHFLTVEVEKNGVPYNRTIIFTVAQ